MRFGYPKLLHSQDFLISSSSWIVHELIVNTKNALNLQHVDIKTRVTTKVVFFSAFFSDDKKLIQKQMAFMLARQQMYLELDESMDDYDDLAEIMSNAHLNNNFLSLAREVKYYYCLLHGF